MENPLISVVVPMYNRETTIERCLLSIINQTYKNIEVIVVDDGSQDNSVKVVEAVAEKDTRIKLFTMEKNSGVAAARNYGIQQVKGGYLAFLDSDDAWRPEKLEKQLKILQGKGADAVFSSFLTNIGDKQMKWPIATNGYISMNTLLNGNVISPTTVLGKSDIWKNIPFDCRLEMYEDWIQMLDVLEQGYRIYFFDEIVTDVYRQSNSISCDALKIVTAAKYIMQRYEKKKDIKEKLQETLTREFIDLGIIKKKAQNKKKQKAVGHPKDARMIGQMVRKYPERKETIAACENKQNRTAPKKQLSPEMVQLVEALKANIQVLLNEGKTEEARMLLEELKKYV